MGGGGGVGVVATRIIGIAKPSIGQGREGRKTKVTLAPGYRCFIINT